MSKRISEYDIENRFLRERFGLPAGWCWSEISCAPEKAPAGFTRYAGSVAPLKANGHPNWRKEDKSTGRTVFASNAERDEWREKTATSEGRCPECWGHGDVFASWSKDNGVKYRQCPKCGGTGKPTAALSAVRNSYLMAVEAAHKSV